MSSSSIFDRFNHSSNPAALNKGSNQKIVEYRQRVVSTTDGQLKKNEQELRNKSLLDSSIAEPLTLKFKDQINAFSALVLTNLGFSAENTGFEGWNLFNAAQLYETLFTMIQHGQGFFSESHKLFDELFKGFKQIQEQHKIFEIEDNIQTSAMSIATPIAQLKVGESFTMVGGWRGIPSGHDMLYRFEKVTSKSFNIYIYNGQKGTINIQGGQQSWLRQKPHPCMAFKGVSWEELFFCTQGKKLNPKIFEKLILINSDYGDNDGSISKILSFFFHIQHRLVSSKEFEEAHLYISAQRSGNCTIKSMNCLILHLLGDASLYKKCSLDLRFFTLIAAYRTFISMGLPPKEKSVRLFQLKEAAANFLNVLNANFNNKEIGITEEKYEIACATIKTMQDELAKIEDKILLESRQDLPIACDYQKATEAKIAKSRLKKIDKLPQNLQPQSAHVQIVSYSPTGNIGKDITWDELDKTLNLLENAIEKLETEGRLQDLVFEVEATLRNLAHLKKKLDCQYSAIQSFYIQKKLLDLQARYNTAVAQLCDFSSPAVQNTSMEFLSLSYCLALRIDNVNKLDVLKNYGIDCTYFFDCARKDIFFNCQDATLLAQRVELENFFQTMPAETWNPVAGEFEKEKFLEGNTTEGRLYRDYIRKSSEIRNALTQVAQKEMDPYHGALYCFLGSDNAFKVKELCHLHQLRSAAILAFANCRSTKDTNEQPDLVENGATWKSYGFYYTKQFSIYTAKIEFYTTYKKDFSPNEELKEYTSNSQSTHDVTQLAPENNLIVVDNPENSLPDHSFYLSLAEPDVQITALLQNAENHLELFSSPKFRHVFLQMLIKNIEKNRSWTSPLILFFKEPLSIRKFERLIRVGKKHFVDTLPENSPKLEEMLFLIRTYGRALQILRQLHPEIEYTKETLSLIQELITFLDKISKQLGEEEKEKVLKKEVGLAKVGLLLGLPFDALKSAEQANFILEFLHFKNHFPSLSSASDPSFVRECKRGFFNLNVLWPRYFKDHKKMQAFGNACLSQALGGGSFQLEWSFEENCLSAKDNNGEIWRIRLGMPSIENSRGAIAEVFRELSATPSFMRLFKDKRYNLKIFGEGTENEVTYFVSPVWGEIQILGKGEENTIQRKIDGRWFTYIPHGGVHQKNLELNDALSADHALWVDLQRPADIRFCNLETGEQVCHTQQNGFIYHDKTGKVFYQLRDNNNKICQFENIRRISGWIDPKFIDQKNGTLELTRFKNAEDNSPLIFYWDQGKWVYAANPALHIDNNSDVHINCAVNRFLCLINDDRSVRKILIPHESVQSEGYSPDAQICLPEGGDVDGQKHSICVFEYDLSSSEEIVPQNIKSKIFLAHLYLAQKNYRTAAALLSTISISDPLTEDVVKILEKFLDSSKLAYDFSPNACACHLLAYHRAKQIDPFLQLNDELIERLLTDYTVYCEGQNNLEHDLFLNLDTEKELVDFLKKENSSDEDFLNDRTEYLSNKHLQKKMLTTHAPTLSSPDLIGKPDPWYFQEGRKPRYINQIYDDSRFQLFAKCYHILRGSHAQDSIECQEVFYNILHKNYDLGDNHLEVLKLIAHFPGRVPQLATVISDKNEQIQWYQSLIDLHQELNSDGKKEGASINFLPTTSTSRTTQIGEIIPTPIPPPITQKALHEIIDEELDVRFKRWQAEFLIKQDRLLTPSLIDKDDNDQPDIKDPLYAHAVHKHKQHYKADRKKAFDKQKEKLIFKPSLIDADYERLIHEMQKACGEAKNNEAFLSKEIEKLATRAPVDTFINYTQAQAFKGGRRVKPPTLETLVRAASQPNGLDALSKLNPYLSEEEIHILRSLCIELMISVTDRQHLERIINPLHDWLTTGQNNATFFEQARLAFVEERNYDPTKQFFPLLFEYLSDVRVREKQAIIINDVLMTVCNSTDKNLKSRAFQLIMAGGKTNVILSMLVELIAESGSLACILCHHSQFASAKGNFSAFQSLRFNKQLYILDFSIEEMSKIENLQLILHKLKEAKRKKCPVLMKTTFPQTLELKFLLESIVLSNISEKSSQNEQIERVEILRQINLFLREEGVSFYDECDLNLSILMDVIIPQGSPKSIEPERASLVKTIYNLLLNPKFLNLSGLRKNLQAEISVSDFENFIKPYLAQELFSYPKLQLSGNDDFKAAFIRYVTNNISSADQNIADRISDGQKIDLTIFSVERQHNIAFLCELNRRHKSLDRYEKESSQLIALTRQMLCKILNVAFSRSFNRNYGRDPEHDDGRVIPYLAVSTPATTRFGNVFLNLALHFQTAVNTCINKGEITFLANKMTEAAEFYAKKEKIPFLNTAEAKQFRELTNVSLVDIKTKKGLEAAYNWINDPEHLERRLNVEAEVAPFHVRYYPKKVSSNPINNVDQFKQAVACSGTLWNRDTYHSNLEPKLDEGTEGSILNLMAERAAKYKEMGAEFIHEIPDLELTSFLNLIKKHPNKKNLRALVDGGGLLRDYSNEQLAKTLKHFFLEERTNGGPLIQAIVYLHKFSEEEIQKGAPKESFVVVKLDDPDFRPHLLKNTTKAEFERLGLKKEDIFVLFDELRGTGTDIELADEALFLITSEHKMPVRTALQSVLRARKLFLQQQAEWIVTARGRKEMVRGGACFDDLKQTWEINEAILLKNQKDRARIAQIENVGRFYLINDLLAKGPKHAQFIEAVRQYEPFLLPNFNDDIVQQEKIQDREDALKVLQDNANHLIKTQGSYLKHTQFKNTLDSVLRTLCSQISNGELMMSTSNDSLEIEVQQEQELVTELDLVDLQQDIAVNHELQHEWESYNFHADTQPSRELVWSFLNPNTPLWEQLQGHLLSLPKTLARQEFGSYQVSAQVQEYAKGFPSNMHMTRNFYQTSLEELPLLHAHTKEVKFVLVLEDEQDKLQFIFLSERDAAFFKEWLDRHHPPGVYLIDSNGMPEILAKEYENKPASLHHEVLKGVCYANLFNGNMEFLDEHYKLTKSLFNEHKIVLARFVLMKTLSKGRHGLNKLLSSKVLEFSRDDLPKQQGMVFSSRRRLIENRYLQTRQLDENSIAELDPQEVENIAPEQVRWLSTYQQVSNLPDELVDYLSPQQIEKKLLPHDKIPLLKNKILIQALDELEDLLSLTEQQQVDLLPLQIDSLQNFLQKAYQQKGLKKINARHFKYVILSEHDIKSLNTDQVVKIHHNQWDLISDKQLRMLQDKDFKFEDFQLHKFNEKQLRFIDISYVNNLSDEQFHKLTQDHTHLIQAISSKEKITLLRDDAVQALKKGQLEWIGENDYQRITNLELLLATPQRCLPWMTDKQKNIIEIGLENPLNVHSLSEPLFRIFSEKRGDIFKLLSEPQVAWLKETEELKHLEEHQLAWLNNDQLNVIDETTFHRIRHVDVLLRTPERCIPWLADIQKKIIHSEKDHPDFIYKVQKPVFQLLLTTDPNIAKKLKKPQIEWLNTKEGINALGSDQIPWLGPVGLLGLDPRHCAHLSNDQIRILTPDHIHLIQALSSGEKLALLNDVALQAISKEQLDFIQENDFKRISTVDLLFAAPPRCIEWLHNYQILLILQSLKGPEQLTEPLFHTLFKNTPQIVKILIQSQISWLKEKQELDELDDHQFSWLDPQQLKLLDVHFCKHLSNKQVSELTQDHIHLIQAIKSEEKLALLNDHALQAISKEQLDVIQENDYQRITNLELLLVTPQRCLPWMTDKQKNIIEIGLQNPLNVHKLNEPLFRMFSQKRPDIFKLLSEAQVAWLKETEELKHLEEHQLAWLNNDQLNVIDETTFHRIRHVDVLLRTPEHCIPWLEDIQKELLHNQKDHPDFINKVQKLVFQLLLTKDPSIAKKLHKHQMDWLNTKEGLNALDPHQIPWIDSTWLVDVDPRHCAHLSDDQIRILTPNHIHLIQAIDSEKRLSLLNEKALQAINKEQLNWIGKNDFTWILNLDLLLATPQRCLRWLKEEQKVIIEKSLNDPSNVQKLNEPLFRMFSEKRPEIFKHLSASQVAWLKKADELKQLEGQQLQWLSEDQKSILHPPQAKQEKPKTEPSGAKQAQPKIDSPQEKQDQPKIDPPREKPIKDKENKDPLDIKADKTTNNTKTKKRKIETKHVGSCTTIAKIAKIVCFILAALIAASIVVVGALALSNVHLSFGPQFFISAFNAIKQSSFAPYLMTAGGGVILLGLTAYAVYRCRQSRHQKMPKSA